MRVNNTKTDGILNAIKIKQLRKIAGKTKLNRIRYKDIKKEIKQRTKKSKQEN